MIISQYGHAFTSLLYMLAGITLLTAGIVFAFLNRRDTTESSNEPAGAFTPQSASELKS
jgi:hypothetical protein